jgi:protein gp37
MAYRLRGRHGYPADEPFRVTLHPDRLSQPTRWKKPRRIFTCSMSDILHPDAEPLWFAMILGVIKRNPQHTFIIVTKRPERMVEDHLGNTMILPFFDPPLKNLWWLVTAENQEMADLRIPYLFKIPSVMYGVSVEPMLGPVDLTEIPLPSIYQPSWAIGRHGMMFNALADDDRFCYQSENKLDWVICGGESGPGARPMHPDWVRSLRDQCQAAGTAFFFKQWGEWRPGMIDYPWKVGKKKAGRLLDGREWNEYPEKGD